MKPNIEIKKEKNNLLVRATYDLRKFSAQKITFFTTKDLEESLMQEGYEIEQVEECETNIIANIKTKGYLQTGTWLFSLKKKPVRRARKKAPEKKA